MYRLMIAIVLVVVMSVPCLEQQSLAQQSIVGTYRLVSVTRIVDGVQQESRGKPSHGYMILTPTHYAVIYTDGERKYGTSDAERAALWDTMTAFSGPYRFDGKKLTISVDTSWNEVYNGTQQVRDIELTGKRMISGSAPRPWGRDPSKQVVLRTEWEKIE
jgi:hypothetical protein